MNSLNSAKLITKSDNSQIETNTKRLSERKPLKPLLVHSMYKDDSFLNRTVIL